MRIGIDVGGSHIGLGLVNKDGKLVLKDEKDYDKRQEDTGDESFFCKDGCLRW